MNIKSGVEKGALAQDPKGRVSPSDMILPLSEVLKYEDEAKKLGVSEVARSKRGFLTQYKQAKTYEKLPEEWKTKQQNFVARHLKQIENHKKQGHNTHRHALALIMWAYDARKYL